MALDGNWEIGKIHNSHSKGLRTYKDQQTNTNKINNDDVVSKNELNSMKCSYINFSSCFCHILNKNSWKEMKKVYTYTNNIPSGREKMKCSKFIKISLLIAKTHLQINKEGCWGNNKKPTVSTSLVTFRYFLSYPFSTLSFDISWGKLFLIFTTRQSHMLSYYSSWIFSHFYPFRFLV